MARSPFQPPHADAGALGPLAPLGVGDSDLIGARSLTCKRIRFRAAPEAKTEPDPPLEREERVEKLEDIRLSIGDKVQIENASDGSKHFVSLIGYAKGHSVIVSTPAQGDRVYFFREGQPFVVRLFAGRGVFAFSATVLRAANTPFPYLHLSYPPEVRGFLLRDAERARVRLIASATGKRVGPVAGVIDDLSPSGARFLARVALGGKGDPLQLKFRIELSGREDLLAVRAIIRALSERTDEGGTQIEHGLQFDGLTPGQQTTLEAFVYRQLLDEVG